MANRGITVILCLVATIAFAARGYARPKNEVSLHAGLSQIQDGLNQSMVYRGPLVEFGYAHTWSLDYWTLRYAPRIGAGVPFDRGMTAVDIRFTPIDLSALHTLLRDPVHTLSVGFGFAARYGYQTYLEQTGGRLFWQGEIGLNIALKYDYRWERRGVVSLAVENSLAGFVSRKQYVEPYFYSLKFTDFFTRPHRNMRFGSLETYSHTRASVVYRPDRMKGHAFGAGVEYVDIRLGERFQSLNCSLRWEKYF